MTDLYNPYGDMNSWYGVPNYGSNYANYMVSQSQPLTLNRIMSMVRDIQQGGAPQALGNQAMGISQPNLSQIPAAIAASIFSGDSRLMSMPRQRMEEYGAMPTPIDPTLPGGQVDPVQTGGVSGGGRTGGGSGSGGSYDYSGGNTVGGGYTTTPGGGYTSGSVGGTGLSTPQTGGIGSAYPSNYGVSNPNAQNMKYVHVSPYGF